MPRPDAPLPAKVVDGLAVYRFGAGPPVLLMPGPHRFESPGDLMADALITGLVASQRHVITFDPPASGHSTRPAQLGMAEMFAGARDALDAADVRAPVDLMGHSMGGLVALGFALANPDRVRRLVLVGTGSGGPAYRKMSGALWRPGHPGFVGLAWRGIAQALIPLRALQIEMLNYIRRMSFVETRWHTPRAIRGCDWFRHREGRMDWQRIARTIDYAPRLAEVRAPTLIMCGRADPQFPPAASQQLADLIPNSRLTWFERSGHYPFIEEPEAFWSSVGAFLHNNLPDGA